MEFALLDGERIKAAKGLRAACPCCDELVIAKCGDFKVHHWAHFNRKMCDPWWETETEWHRKWKDEFPEECREFILHDPLTGEKHIIDIKAPSGAIIEFQHSQITEEERISRESFYTTQSKHMIWVLDCSERSLKFIFYQGFIRDREFGMGEDKEIMWFGRHKIFHKWIGSKVFVLLDFGDDVLWWLKGFDPVKKTIIVNARYKSIFIKKSIETGPNGND